MSLNWRHTKKVFFLVFFSYLESYFLEHHPWVQVRREKPKMSRWQSFPPESSLTPFRNTAFQQTAVSPGPVKTSTLNQCALCEPSVCRLSVQCAKDNSVALLSPLLPLLWDPHKAYQPAHSLGKQTHPLFMAGGLLLTPLPPLLATPNSPNMAAGKLSSTHPPWPFKAPPPPLALLISQHLPICWATASQLSIWLASSSWLFSFFSHAAHLYEENTKYRVCGRDDRCERFAPYDRNDMNSDDPTKAIRDGLLWHLKRCLFDLWPRATANTNTHKIKVPSKQSTVSGSPVHC